MLEPVYQRILMSIPEGIERVVFNVLMDHVGAEHAIKRNDSVDARSGQATAGLVTKVNRYVKADDRQIRVAIANLRKDGHLIASCSSAEGGYYLPNTLTEFNEFVEREFDAKIRDMSETRGAMMQAAQRLWGKAYQKGLF